METIKSKLEPLEEMDSGKIQLIPVDQIQVAKQPRSYFSPHGLELLAQSFRESGFQGVINVQSIGHDRYEVVAGERRLRAAKLAGLNAVHCVVGQFTPEEALEFALRENLQREDLSKIEETEALLELLTLKLKLERSRIIDLVSKEGHTDRRKNNQPKSVVFQQVEMLLKSFDIEVQTFRTKHLRTLALPKDVRRAHLECGLPYSSALEIGRVKDEETRTGILKEALAHEYSVRDVQSIVQQVAPLRLCERPKPSDRLRAIAKRLKTVETSVSTQAQLDAMINQFIDALDQLCKPL